MSKFVRQSTLVRVGDVAVSTLAVTAVALLAFPFVAFATYAWAEKRFFSRKGRGRVITPHDVPAGPPTDPITGEMRAVAVD